MLYPWMSGCGGKQNCVLSDRTPQNCYMRHTSQNYQNAIALLKTTKMRSHSSKLLKCDRTSPTPQMRSRKACRQTSHYKSLAQQTFKLLIHFIVVTFTD
ncbi:hypothetical protein H6G35_19240 [Aulosira sp. FACHB-113]|uniref:hypothetical protein n=1 Tax=Tolypothrix tenuis TaxID=457083 RepID=UPI001681D2F5|nr:hypothetical protein [Aulosira sp. FACHB-113]